MKRIYISIILLLLVSQTTYGQTSTFTAIPGKGFNDFTIGKTTFEEIIAKMGTNNHVDTFYVKPLGDVFSNNTVNNKTSKTDIFSYGLYYDSLGISFFKYKNKKSIFLIHFQTPASVTTDKNIKLNYDNFKEVVSKYGQTQWTYTAYKIFKEYNGIRFEQSSKTKLPLVMDKDSTFYLSKTVTGISIIKKTKKYK